MKIIASRLDDVLREKEEYDARRKAYNDAQENAFRNYRQASNAVTRVVKEYLEQDLANFPALNFEVRVDQDWKDMISARVLCNEANKFAKTSALSWSYEAKLNQKTGEVISETSSWSGLKATTPAQLDSLRQTVEALEYLNNVDWARLLDVQMPNFDDYAGDIPERVPDRSFSAEIAEAAIEDIIGTNKAIRVYNYDGSDYNPYVKTLWMMVERATPSRYVADFCSGKYDANEASDYFASDLRRGWGFRQISKMKIGVVQPVEIIEVDTTSNSDQI